MWKSAFLSISTLLGLATLVEAKEPVPRTTNEQSRAAGKVGEFVLKSAVQLIEGFGELVQLKGALTPVAQTQSSNGNVESQWNRFVQWVNDDDPNERIKQLLAESEDLRKANRSIQWFNEDDRTYRIRQLLAESDDLRKANEERHRQWERSMPSTLSYDQLKGKIGHSTPNEKSVDAPMTLEDIVELATGGISDDLILNQMRTTGTTFALGTKEILFLKKNEVSDRVVTEMQNSRGRHKASNKAVSSKMP